MTPIRCSTAVRFSEQTVSIKTPSTARERLIQQALFRDQVQAAIYQLVRGYEVTTGLSVVRLEYDPQRAKVAIEALPLQS
jgi:hypothetical protein